MAKGNLAEDKGKVQMIFFVRHCPKTKVKLLK